jgi:hypothetical protein
MQKVLSFQPVRLAVHRDAYRAIHTVSGALQCLMEDWPTHQGEAFTGALQACVDAMDEKIRPGGVRRALIKAAQEAELAWMD